MGSSCRSVAVTAAQVLGLASCHRACLCRGWLTGCQWSHAGGDSEEFQCWWDRLEAVTTQYNRVLMLGDSMGATGALLFSPLATAVHAFTPQVHSARFLLLYRTEQAAKRATAQSIHAQPRSEVHTLLSGVLLKAKLISSSETAACGCIRWISCRRLCGPAGTAAGSSV